MRPEVTLLKQRELTFRFVTLKIYEFQLVKSEGYC